MGMRTLALTPGREQPPSRMTTSQREPLISAAGQAQQMSSPQRPEILPHREPVIRRQLEFSKELTACNAAEHEKGKARWNR